MPVCARPACAKARGRPARVKQASVADGIKNRSEFSATKRAFAPVWRGGIAMKQGAKNRLLRAVRKAKGQRLPVFLQPPLSGWGRSERLLRQARAARAAFM